MFRVFLLKATASLVLLFLVGMISGFEVSAADKVGGYDRVLLGTDGFTYKLITQNRSLKTDESSAVEVPALTISGSPLYEGSKIEPSGIMRVTTSLSSIQGHGRLYNSVQPTSSSEWVRQGFQISISPEALQNLMRYLGQSFSTFRSASSGITEAKAQLLYALFFGKAVILSTEAKEAQKKQLDPNGEVLPTLESLGLSAEEPYPAPTRVPIDLSFNIIWDKFVRSIMDIYVESLEIPFLEKEVSFDASQNTVSVRLQAAEAVLVGDYHNTGRSHDLARYLHFWPFWFWEDVGRVPKARIGAFEVRFSFRLVQSQTGFWSIKFADPKRPLVLKMLDAVPSVVIDSEGGKSRTSRLSQKVITRIEEVLSNTLTSAVSSVWFPDDFGYRFPLRRPLWETPGAVQDVRPNTEFELRLANIYFGDQGVQLSMDCRMNTYVRPACVQDLKDDGLRRDLSRPENLPAPQQGTWRLVSRFPGKDAEEKDSKAAKEEAAWHLESVARASKDPSIQMTVASEAMQLMTQAVAESGLYCVSTRALWPRSGYTPLYEFSPTQLPVLRFDHHQITASVAGKLASFSRKSSEGRDRFEQETEKPIEFKVQFSFDRAKKEVQWALPQEVGVSGEAVEDKLVKQASSLLLEPLLGAAPQGKAVLGSQVFKKFMGNAPAIEDLQITPAGISLSLNPGNFDWMKASSHSAEEKTEKSKAELELIASLAFPRSERSLEIPALVTSPDLQISWKPNSNLFFSWRVKNSEDSKWGPWSPFEATDRANVHFDKSGKYFIQVKSMNRAFQIEEEFLAFETYYQEPPQPKQESPVQEAAPPAEPTKPTVKNVETSPRNQNALESKGFFGCGLQERGVGGFSEIVGLLLALFLGLGIRRGGFKRA